MRKCWPPIGCPVIDLPGSGAHSGWHCPRSGQWAKNKIFREYQKKLGFWRRAILEKAARRHYRYLKPSFERVHCPIINIWSIYALYSITYHKAWRGVYIASEQVLKMTSLLCHAQLSSPTRVTYNLPEALCR